MNTSSFVRCFRLGPSVAATSLLLAFAMFAASGCRQGEADRASRRTAEQPAEVTKPVEGNTGGNGEGRQVSTRVTIDFPGGTLGDLRNYLPKAPNQPFNLIVGEDAASIPLPAFSVRDADSSGLARALNHQVFRHGFTIEACDYVPNGGSGAPSYVTYRDPQKQPYDMSANEFLSVEIDPKNAPRLAEAVQSAWQVRYQVDKVPATLRYHAETRQLFVSGWPSALRVFDDVLKTLPKEESAPAAHP